ncbi:hypothetical protein E2C01_040765 [Portunus trituberculatus]|uniref:Uncharacterized protein n=1 Tax=Portunus trituberculatus TaxID=210409 RepID=A0A5B7FI93_PORTR|nr:hypothetical protein [Portunus trituberculatus]
MFHGILVSVSGMCAFIGLVSGLTFTGDTMQHPRDPVCVAPEDHSAAPQLITAHHLDNHYLTLVSVSLYVWLAGWLAAKTQTPHLHCNHRTTPHHTTPHHTTLQISPPQLYHDHFRHSTFPTHDQVNTVPFLSSLHCSFPACNSPLNPSQQ